MIVGTLAVVLHLFSQPPVCCSRSEPKPFYSGQQLLELLASRLLPVNVLH